MKNVTTDKLILARTIDAFAELLKSAYLDDKRWRKLSEGLHRHGLLTVTTRIKREVQLPEIDTARLANDRRYRKQIAAELSRPLPSDLLVSTMVIDRKDLANAPYLQQTAETLGIRFWEKLDLDQADIVAKASLLHLNAAMLSESLERLFRYQSNAGGVSHRIMWIFAMDLIDKDPATQAIFADLNSKMDQIEEDFKNTVDQKLAKIQSDTNERLAAVVARAHARCDALQAKIAGLCNLCGGTCKCC